MRKALVIAALLPLAMTACGGDSKASREDVLDSLTNEVILPKYEKAASSSRDLETKVKAACANPASVPAATDALETARLDWKRTEAVFLGPVMDQRTDAYVDYKVDTADVERLATTTSPSKLDPETVGKRVAADQRGYGALEYLLTTPNITTPRGCEYASSLAKVAADGEQAALEAWKNAKGSDAAYAETIVKDPNMSLDDLVNDSINTLRAVSDLELRAATGRNGAAGDATAIKEGALNDGTTAIRARVEGVRDVMVGSGDQKGLSELLTAETVDALKKALDDSFAAMNAVPGSLRAASQQDKQKVSDIAERLDDLRRIISTEVVSQLGVAVGFSDSDGDSAA
jgi:predicted lipoprotein